MKIYRVHITEEKCQGHRIDYVEQERANQYLRNLKMKDVACKLEVIWA